MSVYNIPCPLSCDECGENEQELCLMPEGQWLCPECCAEYWIEDFEDEEGGE